MNSFEKMYSAKEAAAVLGVSADTVLRLIRKGHIKAWRLPGSGNRRKRQYEVWRIPEIELLHFMKRNAA